MCETLDFSQTVRKILTEDHDRWIGEIADAMGIERATFYARVNGRTFFRPAEIARLLKIMPDRRLFDCLLRDSGFVAVRRPAETDDAPPGGAERALEAALSLSRTGLAMTELLCTRDIDEEAIGAGEELIAEAGRRIAILNREIAPGRAPLPFANAGRLDFRTHEPLRTADATCAAPSDWTPPRPLKDGDGASHPIAT